MVKFCFFIGSVVVGAVIGCVIFYGFASLDHASDTQNIRGGSGSANVDERSSSAAAGLAVGALGGALFGAYMLGKASKD